MTPAALALERRRGPFPTTNGEAGDASAGMKSTLAAGPRVSTVVEVLEVCPGVLS
jgi:hypothetical protein